MKKVLLIVIAVVTIVTSCNEDLLNTKNPNQITNDAYYTTVDRIGSALTSVYAVLQGNGMVGREYFFVHDLRSDDMKSSGGGLEVPRNQLLTGSHTYTNQVMTDLWSALFVMVHRANIVIVNGSALSVSGADQDLLDRYIAEARFLRGFAYYNLGALWGGVPIYDKFATSFADAKPRSTQDQVFDFALADATAASLVLPPSYDAGDKGRITKGAALTLAGKVNLCKGDYNAAKTALEGVKTLADQGYYALVDDYNDNFLEETEYNEESIFEVGFLDTGYGWDLQGNGTGGESWMRHQEYSAISWCNLIPTENLMAAFEDGDPRLGDTFYFPGETYANGTKTLVVEYTDPDDPDPAEAVISGDNSTIYKGNPVKIRWKKYSIMYKAHTTGTFTNVGVNYRLWRYADVLLLLAECENEVGTAQNAIDYLNEVRNRPSVSMPNYGTPEMNAAGYPVSTKEEIRKAVQHERQIELSGEEIRNIDILRWRKHGKLTGPDPISYFQANKYELLPIPQVEFNTNPNVTAADQNPGY